MNTNTQTGGGGNSAPRDLRRPARWRHVRPTLPAPSTDPPAPRSRPLCSAFLIQFRRQAGAAAHAVATSTAEGSASVLVTPASSPALGRPNNSRFRPNIAELSPSRAAVFLSLRACPPLLFFLSPSAAVPFSFLTRSRNDQEIGCSHFSYLREEIKKPYRGEDRGELDS
uniref:Uncharacterized protein n=1 Tax=Oryza meridionalis TaxID=40149 RepID=A0A0E0CFX8_9ORYZ